MRVRTFIKVPKTLSECHTEALVLLRKAFMCVEKLDYIEARKATRLAMTNLDLAIRKKNEQEAL